MRIGEFSWVWLATIGLFAASALLAPGSVTIGSLASMLPFAGILAIVAVGQTLVIQQRGLDMSSAGMVSLAGTIAASVGVLTNSIIIAVVAALIAAVVLGIVNGILTSKIGISPLVATLATNAVLIGGVRSTTGNAPISVPESLQAIAHARVAGVPSNILLAVMVVAIAWIVMHKTTIGRRFVAVGINPSAAASAGISLLTYQIGTYVAAALCFAVGGLLLAGFIGSASHTAGNDYLMPAIAAVVVGGTPFTGGRGSVIASAVAALFMTQLSQLVLALGASSAVQLLVQATAILMATALRNLPALLSRLPAVAMVFRGASAAPKCVASNPG
ncbi:ABC transporter permease [Bradyrhizobium tropiciagri]|nr:ABC transporter permease [Bradyrhizobium tropiciagri]